jgi:branched-chain amino acid transport system substrate-binding protein
MGPEAHPDMPKFIEAYTAMYGSPPGTAFVATGYDTVMLMAKAVEIAGSTDGDAVAQALTSNEFDLLTGKLRYRSAEEGHMPDKAAVLVALDAGKPRFIGWRTPANPPPP